MKKKYNTLTIRPDCFWLPLVLNLSLPESVTLSQYNVVVPFESVDETLVCDQSNESLDEQYFHVVLFVFDNFETINSRFFPQF